MKHLFFLIKLFKILNSKSYGVGDKLPKNYKIGDLDSIECYRVKSIIKLLADSKIESLKIKFISIENN